MESNKAVAIRISLTDQDVRVLVRLAWKAVMSVKNPEELDWNLVRAFTILLRAAKDRKLDVRSELASPGAGDKGEVVIRRGAL